MRTTVTIPDDLLARAKKKAAESGKSLTRIVEDALRRDLAGRTAKRREKRVRLVTSGSGGVAPGVDLDDSAALLDVMEPTDAALRR